jgi:hypothetical protein
VHCNRLRNKGLWRLFLCRISLLWISLLIFQSVAFAFPPAPYYSIYGIVRDQVGQTISAEGAQLVLLKGTREVGRTSINSNMQLDQNYELQMRIDQNRSGTSLYSEKAIVALSPYSLAVEMNGVRFYPIEVSGTLTAGRGGERVRLDLNLGEDLDKDGLPDVWEQWQLYQAGYFPDENGNWDLSLIDRNGDFDGDGMSNWLEYIAGTFAGDATERFGLEIKEKQPSEVRLEFFAITGKTYTIESSPDMLQWKRIPFSSARGAEKSQAYRATDVGILSAFAAPESQTKEFYRLTVR